MLYTEALNELLSRTVCSEEYQIYGKSLVEKSELIFPFFQPWIVKNWSNWEINPFNNRTWQWKLNYLSYLSYLIAYFSIYKNENSLNIGRDSIIAWCDNWLHTVPKAKFEFAWHDHGTALRAEQLLLFIAYVNKNATSWLKHNNEFFYYIIDVLSLHATVLASEDFYSKHTNHGLEQNRVLLLLSTVLKNKNSQIWKEIALNRIYDEFIYSFTKEGVHKEGSPGYHYFVLNIFIDLFKYYKLYFIEFKDKFFTIFNRALEFLTYIIRPDGKFPILGDTECLSLNKKYENYFFPEYILEYFKYSLKKGYYGKKPSLRYKIYKNSGYAIFRNDWFDHNEWKKKDKSELK